MTLRQAIPTTILAASMVIAAACEGGTHQDAAPLPAKPATLTVNMADFYFVLPSRVPAGRVVFDVTNAGQSPHQLSLFRLPEGAPAIDEQLRTSVRPTQLPLQNMAVLQPGLKSTFAVDLVPGARYAMASLVAEGNGLADARRGMTAEFRAGGRVIAVSGQPR